MTSYNVITESEVKLLSPRTGRPKSEAPKDKLLQVRMDEQWMTLLDSCARDKDTTRAEIIREGILLVREAIDNGHKK